ncbi:MAG: DUF5806 family protein [Methanoregula sp.]|jgi:hypothetical protein|nr:DUF5806 family protein [Methanoregula sp.]
MDDEVIQQEISKYKKFKKVDGATYRKVNQFLRKRTYITAREWALARLCTDFRTSGGAEMTFIGKHLPELVPFMEDTYSPQAVNQARHSFKKKVRKASATFFYGAMCGFFTTDELDDLLFEASEVSRFLLEVEGTTLDIDEEIDIEDRITHVMRSVGETAKTILKTRTDDEMAPATNLKKVLMDDGHSTGSNHTLKENPGVLPTNIHDRSPDTRSNESQPPQKPSQERNPEDGIAADTSSNPISSPSPDKSGLLKNNVHPDEISSPPSHEEGQ